MSNTNNLLNEVEDCINHKLDDLTKGTPLEDLNFKFVFKPVLFNHEKRGHMVTSSPLNSILEHNKSLKVNSDIQIDVHRTVSLLTERLNELIKNSFDYKQNQISRKLSHFTHKDGVISAFLSDKKTIQELIEYTKELINSDEDCSDRGTDDADPFNEESQESEPDDSGDNECQEMEISESSESVFKESIKTMSSETD